MMPMHSKYSRSACQAREKLPVPASTDSGMMDTRHAIETRSST